MKKRMQGTCRKFPQGSIQNHHFCEPQGPSFFLALENEWNLPCMSKHSQEVQFFFFFLHTQISWSVFSLLAYPIVRYPLFTSNWLFSVLHVLGCGDRGRKVWEGGGNVAWLILTALRHASPKPCFLEEDRTYPVAPLWAASQCPSGRTAGCHILQTPAFFVLLDNVAHQNSKESEDK